MFARDENPVDQNYAITRTRDALDSSIPIIRVNVPRHKPYMQFQDDHVDAEFAKVLDEVQPVSLSCSS